MSEMSKQQTQAALRSKKKEAELLNEIGLAIKTGDISFLNDRVSRLLCEIDEIEYYLGFGVEDKE